MFPYEQRAIDPRAFSGWGGLRRVHPGGRDLWTVGSEPHSASCGGRRIIDPAVCSALVRPARLLTRGSGEVVQVFPVTTDHHKWKTNGHMPGRRRAVERWGGQSCRAMAWTTALSAAIRLDRTAATSMAPDRRESSRKLPDVLKVADRRRSKSSQGKDGKVVKSNGCS